MNRPAVTRGRLGAWLLKCNPAAWDLRGFVASGQTKLTSWAVHPSYRTELMNAGDRVLFWVSGSGRDGFVRGVWGSGDLVAEPEPWSESSPGFWRNADGHHGVRARVGVDIRLWPAPVPDTELRSAGVDDLEVQRQPFAANPSWVTTAQWKALRPLLPECPPSDDPPHT